MCAAPKLAPGPEGTLFETRGVGGSNPLSPTNLFKHIERASGFSSTPLQAILRLSNPQSSTTGSPAWLSHQLSTACSRLTAADGPILRRLSRPHMKPAHSSWLCAGCVPDFKSGHSQGSTQPHPCEQMLALPVYSLRLWLPGHPNSNFCSDCLRIRIQSHVFPLSDLVVEAR